EIPPAAVPEAFGDDIRQTWVNNNYAMEGIVHEHEGEGHEDFWGIRWVRIGSFNQIEKSPLAGASPEQALQYRFPDENLEDLLARMTPVVDASGDCFLG